MRPAPSSRRLARAEPQLTRALALASRHRQAVAPPPPHDRSQEGRVPARPQVDVQGRGHVAPRVGRLLEVQPVLHRASRSCASFSLSLPRGRPRARERASLTLMLPAAPLADHVPHEPEGRRPPHAPQGGRGHQGVRGAARRVEQDHGRDECVALALALALFDAGEQVLTSGHAAQTRSATRSRTCSTTSRSASTSSRRRRRSSNSFRCVPARPSLRPARTFLTVSSRPQTLDRSRRSLEYCIYQRELQDVGDMLDQIEEERRRDVDNANSKREEFNGREKELSVRPPLLLRPRSQPARHPLTRSSAHRPSPLASRPCGSRSRPSRPSTAS